MMLAEELEADWTKVLMEQAPAESIYVVGDVIKGFIANELEVPSVLQRHADYAVYKLADMMNMQITGSSASVRFTGQAGMRRAGAAAKEMLIRAAAVQWEVAESGCEAKLSYVHHHASGRSASYGELAVKVSAYTPSLHPTLKERKNYTICGKSLPRFDTPAKVVGKQIYGIDVNLPGLKYAAIRHAPVFGGTAISFDESGIKGSKGIEATIQLADSVVVIADNYWRAKSALDEMPVEFSDGENGKFNTEEMFNEFE
jgi:isoquinoline 1-oxidoreductase beta subunit